MIELTKPEYLESYLSKKANIETLEDNLYWKLQEYYQLEAKKDSLDLDRVIPSDQINGLFQDITLSTREVLKLSPSEVSKIDLLLYDPKYFVKRGLAIGLIIGAAGSVLSLYDGSFSPMGLVLGGLFGAGVFLAGTQRYAIGGYWQKDKEILTMGKKEFKLTEELSQGYIEHILKDHTHLYDEGAGNLLWGHSLGIRLEVCRMLSERYDDEGFIYQPLKESVTRISDSYLHICKLLQQDPKLSLTSTTIPSNRDGFLGRLHLYNRLELPYDLGTAAVFIGEQKHGKSIYRQILAENLSFLRAA